MNSININYDNLKNLLLDLVYKTDLINVIYTMLFKNSNIIENNLTISIQRKLLKNIDKFKLQYSEEMLMSKLNEFENFIKSQKEDTIIFEKKYPQLFFEKETLFLYKEIFITKNIDWNILIKLLTYYNLFKNNSIPKKNFNFESLNISLDKVAYLDFGVIEHYNEYAQELKQFKENESINFVYSYVHAQELLKREKTKKSCKNEIDKFKKNLTKLTNNYMLSPNPIKNKKDIKIGEIDFSIKILNYEDLKIFDIVFYITYKEFYKSFHDFIIKNDNTLSKEIGNCETFNEILKIKDISPEKILQKKPLLQNDNINQLKNTLKTQNKINYLVLDNTIWELLAFFNIIKYKCDKKIPKIISSYYDSSHISAASNCKFLITLDKKFKDRAQVIYDYLGIKTKIIYLKELKSFK